MIQKYATTVPEPTADLKQVEHLLSVTVPNAVTMEKSSCDTVDYNSMYHNAFENLKSKIRGAETRQVKEHGSSFSQMCEEKGQGKEKRRKVTKEFVDIRAYFRKPQYAIISWPIL